MGWIFSKLSILTRLVWYPSSKTCSACGAVKQDLTLKHTIFTCECGHTQDRDLNAAINLAHYAVSDTV
jgi:putative transposase